MQDDMPTQIRIMPDYGPSYAHDEDGCVFDITVTSRIIQTSNRSSGLNRGSMAGLRCWKLVQ